MQYAQQLLASGQITQNQFNAALQQVNSGALNSGGTPLTMQGALGVQEAGGAQTTDPLGNALSTPNATGPVNLSSYSSQYSPAVLAAAQNIFAQKPDQAQAFQTQYGGNLQSWLNSFTQWWTQNGPQVAGQIQNFQPETALLGALGFQQGQGGTWVSSAPPTTPGPAGGGDNPTSTAPAPAPGSAPAPTPVPTTNEPAEEGIYNEAIGGLNNEILNDQNLAKQTQQLQTQNQTNYDQLGNVLQSAVAPPGGLSAVTQQDNTAAQTSAAAQIAALSNSVASMQSSLSGTLKAQAAALATTLQQVQANIGQYGSTATQALITQTAQQLQDLQTSIGSQKQALTQQIQSLSGNADAASQAQLAALTTQLNQLNTAEAPVAQARTQAAQAQVTAVNIAEAQTKNQIQGQNALQGFIGGSSMEDNAIAQSGITANQNAAAVVGQADLQNASDYQGIANLGANSQDSLANALAQQKQAIGDQGATGEFNLDTGLATGTQSLNDTQAAGKAAITGSVAQQQESAGNTAAEQGYANTVAGLNSSNQLADALATGTAGINSNEAQQVLTNTTNQYGQSLSAALGLASIPGQEASSTAQIDGLQNAGLLNAQQALNWWSSPATAPTPTTSLSTTSTAGNGLAAAGSSLLGGALSIGNSNNWWQTNPSTSTTTNTSSFTPAATSADNNQFNIDTSLVSG